MPELTLDQITQLRLAGAMSEDAAIGALRDFFQTSGISQGNLEERIVIALGEINAAIDRGEQSTLSNEEIQTLIGQQASSFDPLTGGQNIIGTQAPDTNIDPDSVLGFLGQTDLSPLELASRTRGGRQDIFEGLVGSQPGFGRQSGLAQQATAGAFDPLSAQFTLQAALPQAGGLPGIQDFRQFLQSAPDRFNRESFLSAFAPIEQAFSATIPSLGQNQLLDAFGSESLQNNIIGSFAGLNTPAFLRGFIPGAVRRRRAAAFEQDPSLDPFAQFLRSPGTF